MRADRLCAALLFALPGCQTFVALSPPHTLPPGQVRTGVALSYHDFHVPDERLQAGDAEAFVQVGLDGGKEADFALYPGGAEARLKVALVGPGRFELAASGGIGGFTTFARNTTTAYAPLDLVAGVRFAPDVTLFAGPTVAGAISLDPPGRGGGFNRSTFSALGGGALGVALESHAYSFIPEIAYLAPLTPGASGRMVQVAFGFATSFR